MQLSPLSPQLLLHMTHRMETAVIQSPVNHHIYLFFRPFLHPRHNLYHIIHNNPPYTEFGKFYISGSLFQILKVLHIRQPVPKILSRRHASPSMPAENVPTATVLSDILHLRRAKCLSILSQIPDMSYLQKSKCPCFKNFAKSNLVK